MRQAPACRLDLKRKLTTMLSVTPALRLRLPSVYAMIIAVDIGNTNLKCAASFDDTESEFRFWTIPTQNSKENDGLEDFVAEKLLRWGATTDKGRLMPYVHPKPIHWQMIQTGKLDWQKLKTEILKIRPKDKFKLVTRRQIPIDIYVDSPDKVGIDRLLAAYAAVRHYGDSPMLIVDAGSAVTVDIVYDRIFQGGAILPGLTALANVCPHISARLPKVLIPEYPASCGAAPPIYPGKNTEDAIQCGLYWGTVGAIRQFYSMTAASPAMTRSKKLRLLVTGGDAEYLLTGLVCVIPRELMSHHEGLALEGMTLL